MEFEDKKVAKSVASALNNNPIGGKHRSAYRFDLWCLKYLPKFKVRGFWGVGLLPAWRLSAGGRRGHGSAQRKLGGGGRRGCGGSSAAAPACV